MTFRKLTFAFSMLMMLIFAGTAWADEGHQHEGDWIIGQGPTGQLALEADLDEAIELPLFSNAFYTGWSSNEPGLEALESDEPDEDFYTLGAGAEIYLKVVGIDAAFKGLETNLGPIAFAAVNDEWYIGDEDAHNHAWWFIDSTDAGFDPLQTTWELQFQIIDLGTTGYTPSETYTATFTPVPEPATLALLTLGGLVTVRRRLGAR